MVRVANGIQKHRRHKKFIRLAKGFSLLRKNVYNQVRLALVKQGQHAYRNRKLKKRDFRQLWIERLSAVLRSQYQTKYSVFINTLYTKHVRLNRKVLSNIAVAFPDVFESLVKTVTK